MTYYNTNKESGETLKNSRKKCETQEDEILEFAQECGHRLSPSHVWVFLFCRKIPLTSVRRAITNLTNRGLMTKTDYMVDGVYGKKEHTWEAVQ